MPWHGTDDLTRPAQRAGGLRPLRGDRRIQWGRQVESGEGSMDYTWVVAGEEA